MKKSLLIISGILLGLLLSVTATVQASTILFPVGGGTGTSVAPTYGQVLVGTSAGIYQPQATSTLGVSGGGGTGTVSTSTSETKGRIPYWTSTAGTPALLGSIASTSLAVASPLTVTGTLGALIGGTNSTINCQTASGSQAGCLSSADWTTFNGKLSNITGYITPGTNVTISGAGTSGSPYVINATGGGSSFGYPFPSNATSTLLTFNGGVNVGQYSSYQQNGSTILYASTSAQSVFVGQGAGAGYLTSPTIATGGNTGFGFDALEFSTTTGTGNLAIGPYALQGSASNGTTGYGNMAFGYAAMQQDTSGNSNVAIGASSLLSNTSGSSDIGIGLGSLYYNTTGANNVAIGNNSMGSSVGNGFNVAIGTSALQFATSSIQFDIAIGPYAMQGASNNGSTGQYNTAIGTYALQLDGSGQQNTAIGYSSLGSNQSGSNSIALGSDALALNTTGGQNIAIGNSSMYANTMGADNVAIGEQALQSNSTGTYNFGLGVHALDSNTTGQLNTGIGFDALATEVSAQDNVGIGYNSLGSDTGNGNTAIGDNSLLNNSTGASNIAIGYDSSVNNTSATTSVVIGGLAGYGSSGMYNSQGSTYLGYFTGFQVQTGSDFDTLLGYETGFGITTGADNTLIGASSGENITTGSNNLVVGYNINAPSATTNNQLDLGNIIFGTGVSGTGNTIAGKIGIGTSSPLTELDVAGDITDENVLNAACLKTNANGTIQATTCGSGGGSGLATSSPIASSNLLEYSATGAGSAFGVATSSLSLGSSLLSSGTLGNQIGGTNSSLSINTNNPNYWTGLQNFTNASTSQLTATSSVWLTSLATPAGTFLAVDPNGKIIATTTPSGSNSAFSPAANYATTGALPSNTYAAGVITEVGTGALSVDGASPIVGNTVLVKNEGTASHNGLYDVTAVGSGIAAFVLTRDTAYNSSSNVIPGIITYVISGTVNADDFWAMTSAAPITIGTTALNYTEVSGGGSNVTSVAASGGTTGLTFSGSPITTSGTLTLGGTLGAANGGTGSTTLSGILIGNGMGVVNTLTVGSGLTLTGTTLTASGGYSPVGSIGQFPYFSASNTLSATSTPYLGLNGNLGIGTTSPFSNLTVLNTDQITSPFSIWADGLTSTTTTYTKNGSYTEPANTAYIVVTAVGGGAGGGAGNSGNGGGGGGSSAFGSIICAIGGTGGGGTGGSTGLFGTGSYQALSSFPSTAVVGSVLVKVGQNGGVDTSGGGTAPGGTGYFSGGNATSPTGGTYGGCTGTGSGASFGQVISPNNGSNSGSGAVGGTTGGAQAGAFPGAGGGGANGGAAGIGGSGEVLVTTYIYTSTSTSPFLIAFFGSAGESIGIGTSSPSATLAVSQNGGNAIVLMISQVIGSFSGIVDEIDSVGHENTGGPKPTCGTGCASVQGDDQTMEILTGTSASSVVVNFAVPWLKHPICIPTNESGVNTGVEASTTVSAVTLTLPTALTGKNVAVMCRSSTNFTY